MIKNKDFLINQYEQVREEFHRRYSIVNVSNDANDDTYPPFTLAVDVVNSLYSNTNKIFASDGSLIVELENEQILVLGITSNFRPKAFASKNQNVYLAVISTGLIKTLFDVSLAIWGDSNFFARHINANGCMPPNSVFSGLDIPRGIESMYFEHMKSQKDFNYTTQPVWSNQALENLSTERRKLMISTFKEALKFCWLHESAHILRGHLDFIKENAQGIDSIEISELEYLELGNSISTNNPNLDQVRCALELDADNFGLVCLFGEAYNVDYDVFPITTFLGSILSFMVLYCSHEVQSIKSRKKNSTNLQLKITHPPQWFRAVMVKEVESIIWTQFQQNRIDLALNARERNLNYLNECLLDISNIHPLYGSWVSNLIEEHYDIIMKMKKEMIDNLSKISLVQKSCK
ncbi:MAG: hypothetical protein WCP16_21540 [Pseudanabaena sp. ELA645]|jgi:hypothetical protein